MDLFDAAANAWLSALFPAGVPTSKVREAAAALVRVADVSRELFPSTDRDVRRDEPMLVKLKGKWTDAPLAPPPPPAKAVRRGGLPSRDYSMHPLGLLTETTIERITGITQSVLSRAARQAGHVPAPHKRGAFDRWVSLYDTWGKDRALAWFDKYGKTPVAPQLRAAFVAYCATREHAAKPVPSESSDASEDAPPEPDVRQVGERVAKTLSRPRLTSAEIEAGKELVDDVIPMPKTRGECVDGLRPCPFARCRYHLGFEVDSRSGHLRLMHGHDDVTKMAETCALDVADRGGATLEEVGELLSVSREHIRQIEQSAFEMLRDSVPRLD